VCSKRLAPTWTDLAKKYEGHGEVEIAKIDCTKQKDICQEQGVRGYPTLKWFADGSGEGEKYSGQRSVDQFETFIKQHLE